jgi:hypothetical protein
MAADLQGIVDGLARKVGSSVAIDDSSHRLLVYSSNADHVDELRVAAIMARRSPERAYTHAMEHGLGRAERPIRIPANREFGMEARVCAPVICMGKRLGYLWLIDDRSRLSLSDMELVAAAAAAAGEVMNHERLLGELERGRERELIRDLLADQPEIREHAAEDLVESGLLLPINNVAALVVKPISRLGDGVSDAIRVCLQAGLESMRRQVSPRRNLYLVRPDHAVALISADDVLLGPSGLPGLANSLHKIILEELKGADTWTLLIGIGDVKPGLSHAPESYREAQWAVRVGTVVPFYAPVIAWRDVGIYRTLMHFSSDQLSETVLQAGLVNLISADGTGRLLRTLECYLDHACDAKATCSHLSIHRATLYYRLRRIEEVAAVDMQVGDDRLALHLGLKVARLTGLLPN